MLSQPEKRILCLEWPDTPGADMAMGGILRMAEAGGLEIRVFSRDKVQPAEVPALVRRLRPLGCIVNDPAEDGYYPPPLFGSVPVVYFDLPSPPRWRGVRSVRCDNSAVAGMAFRELSAGLPDCYAAVPSSSLRHWNVERIAAFRAMCADAGKPCFVFHGRRGEAAERRVARLAAWAARLPARCAIFATNDNIAVDVATALGIARRNVPRDCTLIGVDGHDTAPEGGDVSLISSVKMDYDLAGRLAAKAVLSAAESRSSAAGQSRHAVDSFSPRSSSDFAIAASARSSLSVPDSPPSALSTLFGPLLVVRRRSTGGRGRREPRILEAVEIIRHEACEGLSAAVLAARFPGSRNLFERRFREAMGHSVLDEILHVRLQRVLDLLSRPDMPISAIAAFSGFSSDRELRQLFLRRFRCSMRQWRVRHSPRAR